MVRGMARVEFFYDYSSPWTYLAFTRIEELCRRHDAELVWRPILVGGIFNTVNPSVYEARQHGVPAKARYAAKDLRDWARFYGLTLKFPPTVFPVVGLDPQEYFTAIADPAYKDRIRANTDECVRRGGFGSPTLFVGDDMYFGNDRLVLVEAAIGRAVQ